MLNRYLLAAAAASVAVLLVGYGDDLEPPWEVRTYIAPTTDATYTQNMSVVRKEWVCPICGYSTSVAPYTENGNTHNGCPNPWGLTNHGNGAGEDGAELVQASPEERLCGFVTARSATPVLIGRPFHPGEPNPMGASDWDSSPWNNPSPGNTASYVHVRAAGLLSDYYDTGANGVYLMNPTSPDRRVRFLVIEPGATRAAAAAVNLTEVADPDNVAAPTQWVIHVNPYLVSNGDQWFVRQHEETNAAGNTTQLRIEVYSKLNGADFALDMATEAPAGLADFRSEQGCQIITNSGSLRIECPRMLSGNNQSATYVLGFTIASNTQTLPCPEEVDYDSVAGCGDLYPTLDEITPASFAADINVTFPSKQAWMVPNAAVLDGYVGTDSTVVEKAANGSFSTNQCWPYRIPPGAVGQGRVIVVFADGTAGSLQRQNTSKDYYYRMGGEWYYHADLWLGDAGGDHPNMYIEGAGGHPTREGVAVGNRDVARQTSIPSDREHYYMIECSFLSTRSDVPLTRDIWATSGTPIETDTTPGSGGFTRVIVGEGANPGAVGSTVGGAYNPGSSTPQRPFYVSNRVAEPSLVSPLRQGGCGATFRDRSVTGDPNDPQVGDPCPISNVALRCTVCGRLQSPLAYGEGVACPVPGCTGTLQWPVRLERVPSEATMCYTMREPLLTRFADDDRNVTIPPEAIKFGPDNSLVPLGVGEFLQTVRVDIPKYQPPSVPAGATTVENNLANDSPYVGTAVAFLRFLDRGAAAFTDGFETHDASASTSWTHYVGSVPTAEEGALVLEGAGAGGSGTRSTNEYPVRGMRYQWRAMPRYRTGSGPGYVHFIVAQDPAQVAADGRPRDGIWTRFAGYSSAPGGNPGANGGWRVEVRRGGATVWQDHYQGTNLNPDGLANDSGRYYSFAIEIGDDLRPKFYYEGRLLGTSPEPLASTEDHAVFLYTTSGDSLFDYVTVRQVTAVGPVDCDKGWTAYYVSPNDGEKVPAADAANVRTAQAGASDAAVRGEYYCPVTDIHYSRVLYPVHPTSGNPICDFSGADLEEAEILPEKMLAAEEFDLFEILVSVLRKAELATEQRTVDLGWVAPGVERDQPNTTAGTLQGTAVPSDQSSREDLTLRNEGNVAPAGTMRAGQMFRPEVDAPVHSRARWAQSVPVTVGTLFRYRPAAGGDVAFTGADLPLYRQDADGAAGRDATARLQAGVRAGATEPYGPRVAPVPMGQPVGNYTGEMLVFLDLNGNGHLDFIDAEAGPTTTATHGFDPEVDEPYEPVSSFATRLRVVESRLPQNDFYSQDLDPTGLYDAGRTNLQVIWVGNRGSAAGATPGDEVAAGDDPTDAASPTNALNVLFANAVLNTDPSVASDPYYRGWLWAKSSGVIDDARALSNDGPGGTNNTSPVAYLDPNNNQRWVLWHRQTSTAAGMSSELRFDSSTNTTWTGSDINEFIYGTGGAREGLTGFVRQGAENNHWLFWHSGAPGSERIRYRWDFDPASRTVNDNEAELPVSNAAVAGSRYDVVYEPVLQCAACGNYADGQIYEAGDPCPVAGCGGTLAEVDQHGYRKPAHYPFTYVRDASVFERIAGGRPFVHVFFSGLVRAVGNADICWVRFNEARMQDRSRNWGKVAFPPVTDNKLYMPAVEYSATPPNAPVRWAGEQLRPSVTRRVFQSRHLDWMVSDDSGDGDADNTNFANSPDPTPRLAGGYGDPELFVGVITESGGVRNPILFRVTWNSGTYERSTGTYVVTPLLWRITPTGDVDLPVPPGHPHPLHANELLEPSARVQGAGPTEEWPSVKLRINPASGTVTWSAPLFNPEAPGDQRAIFNTDFAPDIVDVLMYANYTPYVTRVTTDPANDDCPSAFYDLGESSRLTVFWRRSFGTTDTPHLGRAAFMHKTYTTAIQVGQPPINSSAPITVEDLNDGGTVPYTVDHRNGIITITDQRRIGNLIRVTYTSAGPGGTRTEVHRIVGWSTETPVPVNTVVSEGALRVVPEIYEVPDGLGGSGTVDVVRYWLFWSSPRAVYDVRAAASDGQRIKQSSDVYCAVVAPEYASLIREADVPRIGP